MLLEFAGDEIRNTILKGHFLVVMELIMKARISAKLFAIDEVERILIVSPVFTEITLAGFVDQCRGYRSWCHAISAFGRHLGLCGTYSLDLMC